MSKEYGFKENTKGTSYEQWSTKKPTWQQGDWLKRISIMIARHATYENGKLIETPLVRFLRNFRKQLLK